MSKIIISAPNVTGIHGKITVDGTELPHVRRIDVAIDVYNVNTVRVELLAKEGLELELDARVEPTFVTFPGHEVITERDENTGRTRVTSKKIVEDKCR